MEIYERPHVELLLFLTKESMASENLTATAQPNSDDVSLGEVPGFTEGIEDW